VEGPRTTGAWAPAVTVDKSAGKKVERDHNLDGRPSDLVSRPAAVAGRRVAAWLVAALAVVVLALAALDGWLVTSSSSSGSRAQRDQALSTAKTAVPLVLSYDYRHFDSDVAAARARLTGRAVTDYAQAMARTIKPAATKAHAVVHAQTDAAGVEAVSSDGNQVTVVVFGEQKVSNASLTAPRIDLFRVRVTLDRVRGQWLVSKFDQI
jgi:Mce-associated membrane protein